MFNSIDYIAFNWTDWGTLSQAWMWSGLKWLCLQHAPNLGLARQYSSHITPHTLYQCWHRWAISSFMLQKDARSIHAKYGKRHWRIGVDTVKQLVVTCLHCLTAVYFQSESRQQLLDTIRYTNGTQTSVQLHTIYVEYFTKLILELFKFWRNRYWTLNVYTYAQNSSGF